MSKCLFLPVGKFLGNIRNYDMPASQDAMTGSDRVRLSLTGINDFHLLGGGWIAIVPDTNRSAVQANF